MLEIINILKTVIDTIKIMKTINDIVKKYNNMTFFTKCKNKIIILFNQNNFLYLSEENKLMLSIIYLLSYKENNEIHLNRNLDIVTSGKLFKFINGININKKDFYIDAMNNINDISYFKINISKSFQISLEKFIYINRFKLEQLIK